MSLPEHQPRWRVQPLPEPPELLGMSQSQPQTDVILNLAGEIYDLILYKAKQFLPIKGNNISSRLRYLFWQAAWKDFPLEIQGREKLTQCMMNLTEAHQWWRKKHQQAHSELFLYRHLEKHIYFFDICYRQYVEAPEIQLTSHICHFRIMISYHCQVAMWPYSWLPCWKATTQYGSSEKWQRWHEGQTPTHHMI